MGKFAQGRFDPKNPEKYVGTRTPIYRSSWEWTFMKTCDENPSIQQWASESIKIPYRDPTTGKQTVYVPDFLIVYVDKDGKKHAEIVDLLIKLYLNKSEKTLVDRCNMLKTWPSGKQLEHMLNR